MDAPQDSKRSTASAAKMNWAPSEEARQAIQATLKMVLVDQIRFDLNLEVGQVRRMEPELVRTRMESLEAAPPLGVLTDILLIQMDLKGIELVTSQDTHNCVSQGRITLCSVGSTPSEPCK